LNLRPAVYKTAALPTELSQHTRLKREECFKPEVQQNQDFFSIQADFYKSNIPRKSLIIPALMYLLAILKNAVSGTTSITTRTTYSFFSSS
jgi:hypothetical protein